MITIYNSKEIDFENNGLGVLNDCIRCEVTQELNGQYSLELEYPIFNNTKYQYLVEDNIIKAPTPKNGYQVFRIHKKVKGMSSIRIYARHIFFDLVNNFLEDVRTTNMTGTQAIKYILSNTQYPHRFNVFSDIDTVNTAYYTRINPLQALLSDDENSFLNRWGGQLEVNNFGIKLLKSIGEDRGYTINYGKNLLGIEENLDLDNVVTRVMPTGLDENNNVVFLPEKYVDSSYINNYTMPKIKEYHFQSIKVDLENGINLENVYQQLRDEVKKLFEVHKIDIPKANYKVSFIELSKTNEYKNYSVLQQVYLADVVTVKHQKLQIDLKAKIIKYKWDAINKKYIDLEMGEFKLNLATELKVTLSKINNVKLSVDDTKQITNKIKNALGGYVLKRENELLIMDTPDINTATKVWRYNINGLGYSSTGYNGEFGIAITMDGEIVANFIKTGELDATLLKVGTITSKNGKFSLNLDDDIMIISGTSKWMGSDGSYIAVDGKDLVRVDGTTKVAYHYLTHTSRLSNLTNGQHVIQLPDEFKGKKFEVTVAVSQAYAKGINGTELLRYFEVRHDEDEPYNYDKGTFTIWINGMSTDLYLNPDNNSIFYIDNEEGIGVDITYTAIA